MRRYRAQLIAIFAALLLAGLPASGHAADTDKPAGSKTTEPSKIDAAKEQVKSGAKQAGEGIKETAKGVGNTVSSIVSAATPEVSNSSTVRMTFSALPYP